MSEKRNPKCFFEISIGGERGRLMNFFPSVWREENVLPQDYKQYKRLQKLVWSMFCDYACTS